MKPAWKIDTEKLLMSPESPSVLTKAMLRTLAVAGRPEAASKPTIDRWAESLVIEGKLRGVVKGVYLNQLGHRNVSPAAASNWIRSRSVVTLSWVLEQAHMTNNFGDTVTCVIPIERGWPNPQVGDRKTSAGVFRFFAMPAALVDERAGKLEDIRDLRFNYPRTTPEKAFLDWIYLGASPRSRMTRPPFDLEAEALNAPRLRRLSKSMRLESQLEEWMAGYKSYQENDDVAANASMRLRL